MSSCSYLYSIETTCSTVLVLKCFSIAIQLCRTMCQWSEEGTGVKRAGHVTLGAEEDTGAEENTGS